jgi:hypothetical protein
VWRSCIRHGADQLGNPEGGLVFGNSYGAYQQYHEYENRSSSFTFLALVLNRDVCPFSGGPTSLVHPCSVSVHVRTAPMQGRFASQSFSHGQRFGMFADIMSTATSTMRWVARQVWRLRIYISFNLILRLSSVSVQCTGELQYRFRFLPRRCNRPACGRLCRQRHYVYLLSVSLSGSLVFISRGAPY